MRCAYTLLATGQCTVPIRPETYCFQCVDISHRKSKVFSFLFSRRRTKKLFLSREWKTFAPRQLSTELLFPAGESTTVYGEMNAHENNKMFCLSLSECTVKFLSHSCSSDGFVLFPFVRQCWMSYLNKWEFKWGFFSFWPTKERKGAREGRTNVAGISFIQFGCNYLIGHSSGNGNFSFLPHKRWTPSLITTRGSSRTDGNGKFNWSHLHSTISCIEWQSVDVCWQRRRKADAFIIVQIQSRCRCAEGAFVAR